MMALFERQHALLDAIEDAGPPTIMAGIRVATVTTIGTATIAAAIGGGGLGVFIFRGVASVDTAQIFAGAVPAALIALAADWGLGWVERKLSPV